MGIPLKPCCIHVLPLMEKIEEENSSSPEEKRISLNTLVNQIVDSCINFGSSTSKARMIPLSTTLITELLPTSSLS
jgi:hypothetical protein